MKAKDLLNYKNLSLLLTDKPDNIRRDKVPKKYRDKVQELEAILDYFISKHKNQKDK